MQVFQGFCLSSHGTIIIKVFPIVLSTSGQDRHHNRKTISKLLFIKRPEQGLNIQKIIPRMTDYIKKKTQKTHTIPSPH